MAALPVPTLNELMQDKVYNAIVEEDGQELWLTRLGASVIGEECLRSMFYSWRGYTHKLFPGRILRLFETGHLQEDRIVRDLLRAGYEVWATDSKGRQFTYTDETGHGVCKTDGVIRGVPGHETEPLVMEIKTHADKSFKDVTKKHVAASKRYHYYQLQMGMWLTGLSGGLYVSLNKNDEQYYFEYVEPNLVVQERIQQTIIKQVEAEIIPTRLSDDQDNHFGCMWCDHKDVCTGRAEPVRHCRSCVNAQAWEGGEWLCRSRGVLLNREEQLTGCSEYEVKK